MLAIKLTTLMELINDSNIAENYLNNRLIEALKFGEITARHFGYK